MPKAKKQSKAIAPVRRLTAEQIDLIKRTIAKDATDDELALFLYQAERLGLDPLSRQIHFVKRWDSSQQKYVGAIQIGIDGFRVIASRTGRYRPDEEAPRFTYDEAGNLRSAKVRVWKWHDLTQQWYPVEAEAIFNEYAQRLKDGTLQSNWQRMPHVLLAKCAEALAIRKAFPQDLSGVYVEEEVEVLSAEPAPFPSSTAQTELPIAELPIAQSEQRMSTEDQQRAIHRIWHAKVRPFAADHEAASSGLDRWLLETFGTESTKLLTFDQASQAISILQTTAAAELSKFVEAAEVSG